MCVKDWDKEGVKFYRQKDYKNAIECFERSLETNPYE